MASTRDYGFIFFTFSVVWQLEKEKDRWRKKGNREGETDRQTDRQTDIETQRRLSQKEDDTVSVRLSTLHHNSSPTPQRSVSSA